MEMYNMFGKPHVYDGKKAWSSLKSTRTDSSIEKGNESVVASDTKPPAQYAERFESILTQTFEDENSWWDAVEVCMEDDDDFKTRVSF